MLITAPSAETILWSHALIAKRIRLLTRRRIATRLGVCAIMLSISTAFQDGSRRDPSAPLTIENGTLIAMESEKLHANMSYIKIVSCQQIIQVSAYCLSYSNIRTSNKNMLSIKTQKYS